MTIGVMIAGVRRVTGALVDSGSDTANQTTYSFAIVPARSVATRYVVVAMWDGNNNRTLSSLLVAGDATTTRQTISESNARIAIADVEVAAGSAGSVVMTLSGNLGLGSVVLVALYDVGNAVYRAGDAASDTDGGSSTNLAVSNGEYVIGGAMAYRNLGGAGAYSWTGLTELIDIDLRDSRLSTAAHAVAADATLAIRATVGTADKNVFAVAAYEPP